MTVMATGASRRAALKNYFYRFMKDSCVGLYGKGVEDQCVQLHLNSQGC